MKSFGKIILPLLLTVIVAGTFSCKTSFDEIRYGDGNTDFARVITIGGSHLSGYSDRALYRESQENSIPAILSTRFDFAGGGTFRQPLVNNGVGIGISENAKYVLQYVMDPCATGNVILPKPVAPTGDVTNYTWVGNLYPFNNLAVPGTKIKDVSNQSYGNPSPFLGNPLYSRFASNPGSSTITGDALLINPTFIIVWMGIEDIYNYARAGGDQGSDSITASATFETLYSNLIDELSGQQPGGVLLNIPSLESFPFFTKIAYNGLMLNASEAAQLNALYAGVDTSIHFAAGKNRYVIADPSQPSGRRHINNGEYILLSTPLDSINCQGWGTTLPIPERYVLDQTEVQKIKNAVITYNSGITQAAVANNIAVADMNTFLLSMNDGQLFNGVHYTSEYLYGGLYSTDGFHFSQRGSAIIANELVRVINNFYAAKLPSADVNIYPGIVFP